MISFDEKVKGDMESRSSNVELERPAPAAPLPEHYLGPRTTGPYGRIQRQGEAYVLACWFCPRAFAPSETALGCIWNSGC